jgi:hypothetical protein
VRKVATSANEDKAIRYERRARKSRVQPLAVLLFDDGKDPYPKATPIQRKVLCCQHKTAAHFLPRKIEQTSHAVIVDFVAQISPAQGSLSPTVSSGISFGGIEYLSAAKWVSILCWRPLGLFGETYASYVSRARVRRSRDTMYFWLEEVYSLHDCKP